MEKDKPVDLTWRVLRNQTPSRVSVPSPERDSARFPGNSWPLVFHADTRFWDLGNQEIPGPPAPLFFPKCLYGRGEGTWLFSLPCGLVVPQD